MNATSSQRRIESLSKAGADPIRRAVAIIPARGGSKGIPRKNVACLGGKPLIAHTIEAARACPWIDEVIVSTEDREIAEIAQTWGAEVPFLRPARLADDISSNGGAVHHVLQRLNGQESPTISITLYPTYPFRSQALLSRCLQPLLKGIVRSTWTALPVHLGRQGLVQLSRNRLKEWRIPTQESSVWQPIGSVLAGDVRDWAWPRPGRVIPVEDPIEQIDIDTPEDLRLAEHVLELGLWMPQTERE